ncbi:LOW QUALITY PROTEIN: centrosomal protein of 164 kDa [Myripristis murdjan]|uniref:LOW QUALITY PROTEIN: centrosomal protein of 164 kDa n=1 Tax=Myripristis murdjan TaxID=586833 RepID=UPI001175E57C|nr:LOW QUALITY PROTEIN: centrosomal protein of 164 kDa [Myripristis murdjan]
MTEAMTAAALIGDQLILEEDYDENYIPSEQEIHEYAREIGIDPDNEPELLWLAREGIVAPLPHEWKPCQDVTGDVYYFNFSTGQSTWDHPCDEHYRRLVIQERERAQLTAAAGGAGAKKDKEKKKKKEKKEKKEKKKKELLNTPGALNSALGPLSSPLGGLAPLRGLDGAGPGSLPGCAPSLRGSLGSSGGLEPLKMSVGAPRSSGASSVLGSRQEERVSLSLPGFDDDDDNDEDKISENEPSPRASAGLLKNLHLDLDALGGGLQYEDSEASGGAPPEERTEPELQDLILSGDHSPEPPSQQDSLRGRHLHLSPLTGSRDHGSPEPLSSEATGQKAKEEVDEVDKEEGEEVENKAVQGEGGEDEGGGKQDDEGAESEEEENRWEEEMEEVEEAKKKGVKGNKEAEEERESDEVVQEEESDEVEEEHGKDEDDEEKDESEEREGGVTESKKKSVEAAESDGRGKDGTEEKVERSIESRDGEPRDRSEHEESSDVVERFVEEKVEDIEAVEEEIEEEVLEEEDEEEREIAQRCFGEKKSEKEKTLMKLLAQDSEEELVGHSDKSVEKCLKSEENEEADEVEKEDDKDSVEEEESEVLERFMNGEEGHTEAEEEEVERSINSKGGQKGKEEDDESESEEVLERCSLSHRQMTEEGEESDVEVVERCVRSDAGNGGRNRRRRSRQSRRETQTASESDEEVVERFETQTAHLQPAKLGQKTKRTNLKALDKKRKTRYAGATESTAEKYPHPAEESEASKHTEDASSSIDESKPLKKVTDVKDLSAAVSPLEKDDKEETEEEEEDKDGERMKRPEPVQRSMPAPKVDRLVLHQSSPPLSLSSPSQSEQDIGLRPKAEGLSASLGLQRPETSRGRLVRTSHTQLEEPKSPVRNWKEKAMEEEKKEERARREEKRLREMEEERERRQEERERERRKAEQEMEEEKECLTKEKEKNMLLLREELKREEEEEERKLREESKERVGALRERLQSKRREEEARLNEESDRLLEELGASAQRDRETQQRKLREESESMLRELRVTLEDKQAVERDRLETQRRRDMEQLRMESEEELQAERKKLLGERDEKLNSLKLEVKSTEWRRELMSPRPEQQLAEYHRELADVLQEVRDEVQRDHDRKLEQLRDDHRRELNSIREKHLDEEAAQRERLLSALQEDREHLQASHTVQLEKLRLQLNAQIQKTQLTHTRKESELEDLAHQLELRAKELKSQEAMLNNKAEELKKKRKKLGEEEEEMDRGIEALPKLLLERDQLKEELERMREEKDRARELVQRAREERSEAKQEQERMREERDKAREESRRAREDKERLESKVDLLQERCDRLSRRVSELEQSERVRTSPRPAAKQEKRKKAEKAEVMAPSSARRDSSLHVEDLDNPPLSPLPDSHSSLDDMRRYISSEGESIHKTRLFLERESSRLMERQAALQTAQSGSSSHDPGQEAGVTQEMLRNLQQEARNVVELQLAVERGNDLLRKKEEQLQQLESSIAEEPLFEDLSRLAGERKVTFDVTESDLSSTVDPQDGTGGHPTVPAKVQQLAESLQQISGQLNTVLSALGSLAQRQSATPYPGFPPPASQPHSTSLPSAATSSSLGPSALATPPPVWLSGSSWAWAPPAGPAATPLFTSPVASHPRVSEDLLHSRWAQLFPGAAVDPVASSTMRATTSYSTYTPVSEQARSVRSMQKSVEMDGQRLQGLIDGNKRWLEMRKKDSSIPLFTRYQAPSSMSRLVQLGLDDNNQIKVYHY